MADHIHEVGDGRGKRAVFVDGKRVDHVIYADTKRGICDYHPLPFKIHKRGRRVISRRLRGNVRVEHLHG